MSRACLRFLTLALISLTVETSAANESFSTGLKSDEMSLMQMTLQVNEGSLSHVSQNLSQADTTTTSTLHFGENESDFAKLSAVSLNDAGDLDALLSSIELDAAMVIGMFVAFMVLARYYPMIYAFRATGAAEQSDGTLTSLEKTAPKNRQWAPDDYSWFRWLKVSYAVTVPEMIATCGMDEAYLVRFTEMSMQLMALVGIPNFFILSMLYCFGGGDAAGADKLSYLGINNVETGSWIFWVVAVMTWYNVVMIQWRLFHWQRGFIKDRFDWLKSMPEPQDTTLLVEGIECTECTDAALKAFFQKIYGKDEIVEAFVVKKIKTLEGLIAAYKSVLQNLHEVEYFIKENPKKPAPVFRTAVMKGDEKLPYYQKEKARLEGEIKAEQKRVNQQALEPPPTADDASSVFEHELYGTNGFVTFKTRGKAEQALAIRLRTDDASFVLSYAPDPADVIYSDLEMTVMRQESLQMIGYGLVFGLACAYMPIIIWIADMATIEKMRNVGILRKIFDASPMIESLIAGQLPSLGLTIMTAMLPTFLMIIFTAFFYLVANRWAQYQLQQYYFWFQVLFVILTTAIGGSLLDTIAEIAESPFLIISILADKMPLTTHFYMNFMVMQWVTQAMNLLRYINLGKYLMFKRFCEPERARQLSEPEDQDYYGMGSRSARFTINLVIGIVFGSMCPLITLFTFINFAICRLVFGYLLPFCETRKDDLGGMFWVRSLHHIHQMLLLYILLMVGIVSQRAATNGPLILCAGSGVWWAFSWYKFVHKLRWEKLAFEDVVKSEKGDQEKRKSDRKSYRQIELDKDIFKELEIN